MVRSLEALAMSRFELVDVQFTSCRCTLRSSQTLPYKGKVQHLRRMVRWLHFTSIGYQRLVQSLSLPYTGYHEEGEQERPLSSGKGVGESIRFVTRCRF